MEEKQIHELGPIYSWVTAKIEYQDPSKVTRHQHENSLALDLRITSYADVSALVPTTIFHLGAVLGLKFACSLCKNCLD